MCNGSFKISLYLPAQAAAETEAIITRWCVQAGGTFTKDQILAEVESAKSTFEFYAPCDGTVVKLFVEESISVTFDTAVIEIETDDQSMKNQIPVAGTKPTEEVPVMQPVHAPKQAKPVGDEIHILGIGTYVPDYIVPNSVLLADHPDINEEYIFGVTGIRTRHWSKNGEKPSDMAQKAALQAMNRAELKPSDIDGIIVSTTTPDYMMPSTSCILQNKLGIRGCLAFDINAACSGWLYGISVAKGLLLSGMATNILVVAVDMQSRLLDKKDRNTYFLFGDGAGATIISNSREGHPIRREIMIADSAGLHMARREYPGNEVPQSTSSYDPWIRLDGKALFRFATERFTAIIKELIEKSGWSNEQVRWIVPHQANSRILKAAATRSGVPFERFYLNIDRVGNTSSASIPLALAELDRGLQKKDKIIFCTVGAGITAAGISIEW